MSPLPAWCGRSACDTALCPPGHCCRWCQRGRGHHGHTSLWLRWATWRWSCWVDGQTVAEGKTQCMRGQLDDMTSVTSNPLLVVWTPGSLPYRWAQHTSSSWWVFRYYTILAWKIYISAQKNKKIIWKMITFIVSKFHTVLTSCSVLTFLLIWMTWPRMILSYAPTLSLSRWSCTSLRAMWPATCPAARTTLGKFEKVADSSFSLVSYRVPK